MGLDEAFRTAAGAIETLFEGVEVEVTHRRWIGDADASGTPLYDAVLRLAVVEEGSIRFETRSGQTLSARARLDFAAPLEAHGAPGRHEPIDPRDRFVLPSGHEGGVMEIPVELLDPTTELPYVGTVWLR